MMDKVRRFAEVLEEQQKERLYKEKLDCAANLHNCKTRVVDGQKYIKVDVGTSGKYMIEKSSGIIFGIKAYGVIHRGHQYGTLGTIGDWDWGGYVGSKKV